MAVILSFPQGDPRKRIDRLRQAAPIGARNAVAEATLTTATIAKQILNDVGAIDRGIARASIDTLVRSSPSGAEGITFVGAEHGRWIEFGRAGVQSDPTNSPYAGKPNFPPLSAIEGWVRRHVKALAPSGRTKSGRARRATVGDVRRVAFLIARAIYRRGIKPRPFMLPAFERVRKGFAARVQFHVLRALANIR